MAGGRIGAAMSSGPAVALTKSFLTIFNFIFWLSGIAVLALGIWTKLQLYIYMELSSVYYKEVPYVLIGVGALIVLVGSFGCCCTFKGNSVLLYMYSGFLVLVFVVELSSGIAGFVYKNRLTGGFKEGLQTAMTEYDSHAEKAQAMDGMQHNLHCCGSDNYVDWFKTPWADKQKALNRTNAVPKSCCRVPEAECRYFNLTPTQTNQTLDVYTSGCFTEVNDFMQKNMALIGGVALGISFFQLIGALLACCLAKNINKAKYEIVQ
ncbi:tetraspanin-7-like [Dreissena polymorpha]|uniref:Tetraspanin n=1 Tax=Dreissena polymorpha TaxID=45954 RepID=A0A9D4DVE7_DREPO|nr:tetraspanin-7-like [Dreissena polymorpha]XP_052235541.1 tetraspanin-7-like [Dreissena polymorpha]KAH3755456.1 hypothetical protein DPMN_190152 [Dreissena polymorpha]KAH3755476.1 hypothetical protein DPMN_190172 [Dreissena polymorpha]